MPSRGELLAEAREHEHPASLRGKLQKVLRRLNKREQSWWDAKLQEWLRKVSDLHGGKEVLLYASGFLENPRGDGFSSVRWEDKKYLMDAFYGMDAAKGLVLIIHTPGGYVSAVQSIIEYMHKMFDDITAVVPLYAMSGGSMISLACDRIVMGKHSQIGPIDPQIHAHGRRRSARNILDTFNRATKEIEKDGRKAAIVWNHFFAAMAPDLLVETEKSLQLIEELVPKWMQDRMFKDDEDAESKAADIVKFLNAKEEHPELGRICMHDQAVGIDALRKLHVKVEELESCQDRQDAVLTVYHLAALTFEMSHATKLIANHRGTMWYIYPPPLAKAQT